MWLEQPFTSRVWLGSISSETATRAGHSRVLTIISSGPLTAAVLLAPTSLATSARRLWRLYEAFTPKCRTDYAWIVVGLIRFPSVIRTSHRGPGPTLGSSPSVSHSEGPIAVRTMISAGLREKGDQPFRPLTRANHQEMRMTFGAHDYQDSGMLIRNIYVNCIYEEPNSTNLVGIN